MFYVGSCLMMVHVAVVLSSLLVDVFIDLLLIKVCDEFVCSLLIDPVCGHLGLLVVY